MERATWPRLGVCRRVAASVTSGCILFACRPDGKAGAIELHHEGVAAEATTPSAVGHEIRAIPSLKRSRSLLWLQGTLIALPGEGDTAAYVVDTASSRVISTVPSIINGHLHFKNAVTASSAGKGGAAYWLFDIGTKRLSRVGGPQPTGTVVKTVDLVADESIFEAIVIGDSVVAARSLYSYARIGIFDLRGRLLRTIGPVPPGNETIPVVVRQQAYQGRLRYSEVRKRFVLTAVNATDLEILGADGSLVAIAAAPVRFAPVYSWRVVHGNPVAVLDRIHDRYGYLDVALSDSVVFALFSGQALDDARGRPVGRELHVFDWSGKLLARLTLDSPSVQAIATDPTGKILYAIGAHGLAGDTLALREYDVGRLLSAAIPGHVGLATISRIYANPDRR